MDLLYTWFSSYLTFSNFLLILLLVLLFWYSFSGSNVPPGPCFINVVIDKLLLEKVQGCSGSRSVQVIFQKYKRKYGDIFSIRIGTKLLIVLNGHDVLKDALITHADLFSDRPDVFIFTELSEKLGILGSSGQIWRNQRKFTLAHIHSFCIKSPQFETFVLQEIGIFQKNLVTTADEQTMDLNPKLRLLIANIICKIMFDKTLDDEDRLKNVMAMFDEFFRDNGVFGSITYPCYFKHAPFDIFRFKTYFKYKDFIETIFGNIVQEHKNSYNESKIRDYVDAFIRRSRDYGNNNSRQLFSDKHLIKTIGDLFSAGIDTTTSAIRWAILFLIQNPEMQTRLREELINVVGKRSQVFLKDKPNLPYCNAFISETLRYGNIVPYSVPHGMRKHTYFHGFFIPKSAIVIPNLESVLCDPDTFPDPDTFDPFRFIDGSNCSIRKASGLAFSLGKRKCLGESLAKMTVFLFVTNLVQNFHVLPTLENNNREQNAVLGITRSPGQYYCSVKRV